MTHRFGVAAVMGVVALSPSPLLAQTKVLPPSVTELKQLTVAELMDIDVTSVSKAAEPRDHAAAAVTVVTADDITRAGATSLPEALRFVPGVYVGRQNSSSWAVGARGFSNVSSEKLLVLSDTRSIYTPLFSGVLWDVQDYLLQDIDRIEVIRGPGATLWGSNAVNGVINVTTKAARDTQGLYAEASLGTEDRVVVAARYGGRLASRSHYRVFAKFFDRSATAHANRTSPDDWQSGRMGFRADTEVTAKDTLTVQGDVYRGDTGQLAPVIAVSGRQGPTGRLRVDTGGGNILGRWRHDASPASGYELRGYYDRTHRDDPSFEDELNTFDVDFQHRFALPRHGITWGLNYRVTANRNHGKVIFAVEPMSSRDQVLSGFVQDHIQLPASLRLTVGTKLEHNDFSGGEVQPSGRIAWDASAHHFVWGSVSRAVRVPTRLERDIAVAVNTAGAPRFRILGNRDFDPERLIAYEAGHRWQVRPSLFIDTAAFVNRYGGLASLDFADSFVEAGIPVVPLRYQNLNSGLAGGLETQVTYSPVPASRLSASYSYLKVTIDAEGLDLNRDRFVDGSTPRHQFSLRSSLDLRARVQIDASVRRLGAIRRLPQIESGEGLPGYTELDLRVAWPPTKHVMLSIVGQNLLHRRHVEFGQPESRGAIERGVYTRVAWGF